MTSVSKRWVSIDERENVDKHLEPFLRQGIVQNQLMRFFARLFVEARGTANVSNVADMFAMMLRANASFLSHLESVGFPVNNEDRVNRKCEELTRIVIAELLAQSPFVKYEDDVGGDDPRSLIRAVLGS